MASLNRERVPIRRRKLALALRRLREERKFTQVEVASWTGLSQAAISKIERAEQIISVRNVEVLAACYGVESPTLDQLLRRAQDSEDRGLLVVHGSIVPDHSRDYIELEESAHELRVLEHRWVFGLFQTPAYVRALRQLFAPEVDEADLDQSVALRLARQERLRGEAPLQLRVVMDESVLHRSVGGRKVMAEQVAHLIKVSHMPTVTLQIVPFARPGHPALGSGFTIVRFADTPDMDVVYEENLRSAVYHEQPNDLKFYGDLFEVISTTALAPDESRELLDTLRRTLGSNRRR
jgi:transcriptional regulator with XRE-family HTH domain